MTNAVHHLAACKPSYRLRPMTRLRDYLALARQRRQLLRLDAQQLADIGLSQTQAIAEAERAPWDVPEHWKG
ncbi:DUF1127 domain-containing protein [Loktanella sp. S4079]|uniref:DUF1127 domain-containing protein n=1 Tax=Loktanella sp. S4079 TaxID=579483 RepID=UPI0005F9E8A4|nr:DUF1127 domain-containing protein [Loktanella sp. S4079]KJZ19710.1 hypothetical protein TW80_02080 [Loktanella sp. S4079]